MIYTYEKTTKPNLSLFELEILKTTIAPSYSYLCWSEELGQLSATFINELSASDKDILDLAIANTPDQSPEFDAIFNFNVETFFVRLLQVFDAGRWLSLSKLGIGWSLEKFVQVHDFVTLGIYIQSLLGDGTLVQDDVDKISALMLEQGINL